MTKNIGYLFVSLVLVSGCAGILEGGGGPTVADYRDPNRTVYSGIPSNFHAVGNFEESKARAHATTVVGDAYAYNLERMADSTFYTGMNAAQGWQMVMQQANGGAQNGHGKKQTKDEDAATRAWRKEALKACVKAGTDLADCRKQVDAEQGVTAETAAPQNSTAPTEAPRPQTSNAPAPTGPATAAPAQVAPANPSAAVAAPGETFTPPAFVPSPAASNSSYFLQFKSQVMLARDKDQLVAALNKAADHGVSNDARALLQDWAKKVGSDAVDWSAAKETIVGSIGSYENLLR